MTLGKVEQLALAQARREAERIIASAKLGRDPAAAKTDKRRGQTIADLAEAWMEATEIEPKIRQAYRYHLDEIIVPRFGQRKARSLTREEINAGS
jgi:hypothetical protein